MKFFELITEYEAKHGSFKNASYDNPDYVKFRVEMIKLETGLDVYDAVAELARQAGGKRYKLRRQYEREFLDVLRANEKDW